MGLDPRAKEEPFKILVERARGECRQIYVGETSRSLRERLGEHIKGASRMVDDNFINKHGLEKYPERDDPPAFIFRINKVHKDPLSREIHEAVLNQKVRDEDQVLNSKSEWNKTSLSRLCIQKSDWEVKKEAIALNEPVWQPKL